MDQITVCSAKSISTIKKHFLSMVKIFQVYSVYKKTEHFQIQNVLSYCGNLTALTASS